MSFTRSGTSTPSSFSTDEAERQAVGLRAEVVHPLDERDHLLPLLLFGGLLDAGVQEADGGVGVDDFLARQLQHDPQHAVRAGVLRPHVHGHRLGAEFGQCSSSSPGSCACRLNPEGLHQEKPSVLRSLLSAIRAASCRPEETPSQFPLHQFADRVDQRPVRFLHPGGARVGHVDVDVHVPADRAAVPAGQRDRAQAAGAGGARGPRRRWRDAPLVEMPNATSPRLPSASICRTNTRSKA